MLFATVDAEFAPKLAAGFAAKTTPASGLLWECALIF
jgi:hypothetical protein